MIFEGSFSWLFGRNVFRWMFFKRMRNSNHRGLATGSNNFNVRDLLTSSNAKMENIENVKVGPMPPSQFLKPYRLEFTQNGRKRRWDFVMSHEGNVLVLVKQFRPGTNTTLEHLFNNGSVYYNTAASAQSVCNEGEIDWSKVPASGGITLEFCAGILDNPKLSPMEIAKQEILEECGYDVPLENFQYIISYRVDRRILCYNLEKYFSSGIGISGDSQKLFYCEVTDEMKVREDFTLDEGPAREFELIDIVEMTIPEVRKIVTQDLVPSLGGAVLFGLMWFLTNTAPTKESQSEG